MTSLSRIRARLASGCSRAWRDRGLSGASANAGLYASIPLSHRSHSCLVSLTFSGGGPRWRPGDAARVEPRARLVSREKTQVRSTSAGTESGKGPGTVAGMLFWVQCERGAAPKLSGPPPGFTFEGNVSESEAELAQNPCHIKEAEHSAAFDISQYGSCLTTECFGRQLLLSRHLESTQTLVAE